MEYEELIKVISNDNLSMINQQLLEFLARGKFFDSRLFSSDYHLQHEETKDEKDKLRENLMNFLDENEQHITPELRSSIISEFN